MKWCTKLQVAYKRCLIVFQGLMWNFKVTWDKKTTILTRIECFRTVTPVWNHRWLWNYAQSLKYQRSGALLIFKVIHQISRSHRVRKLPILTQFECFQSVTRSFEFADGFEMMHKAQHSTEEVPYWFSRSSVKISRSHRGKNCQFWP